LKSNQGQGIPRRKTHITMLCSG